MTKKEKESILLTVVIQVISSGQSEPMNLVDGKNHLGWEVIGYLPKEFNWLYLKLSNILTSVTTPSLKIIKREAVCVGSNDDGTPRYEEFNDEFIGQFVLQNK